MNNPNMLYIVREDREQHVRSKEGEAGNRI